MSKDRKIEVRDIVKADSFQISKSQWKKWNNPQKAIFEEVYTSCIENQDVMKHPKGPTLHKDHWGTLVHNFAWMAADGLKEVFEGEKYGEEA